MSIKKSIGKNTLGGGKKLQVDLKTFNRSTHNLSMAFRSSMNCGTLIPAMKLFALPGDTFNIEIAEKILTEPTVGPLFGSYKLQIDVFTAPLRLYINKLHNNPTKVGMNMSSVKLPMFGTNLATRMTNTSSLVNYLGYKYKDDDCQCAPVLMYYDIFKCFYANKQEPKFYVITNGNKAVNATFTTQKITVNQVSDGQKIIFSVLLFNGKDYEQWEFDTNNTTYGTWAVSGSVGTYTFKSPYSIDEMADNKAYISGSFGLTAYDLEDLDEIRDEILATDDYQLKQTKVPFFMAGVQKTSTDGTMWSLISNGGICVKTHQSDIFNNWINAEWIDGENGISNVTAIDLSEGKLKLDVLNLQEKIYNMLNRVAVSGGTYQDWIEVVYSQKYYQRPETPMYEGGLSAEIIFNEVISNTETDEQPLGTLAGRGASVKGRGGKLKINVTEPSYVIAIASITPRVDYSQGNDFDIDFQNMNDFHKPDLTAIGYQDLTQDRLRADANPNIAIGKQPAWLDYMTNYNRTFGTFASGEINSYMCLNRHYDKGSDGNITNATTYINPTDYNYIFARTTLDSQPFWVQIGFKVNARRMMSAKQIPNL